MKKCYALIIGINEYPSCPLNQCVADATKMNKYVQSLKSQFDAIEIELLLNKKANKKAIVKAITNILKKLNDKDTFLFYFSGHGAQEMAEDRFKAEQDDLLECLVCSPKDASFKESLFADKELRYLMTLCPSNPHIVTIFDCCHSGDMVRSTKKAKRIIEPFSARPYHEFIFHGELPESQLQAQSFTQWYPFKNTIHIAACQSNQFAWEDSRGGVFTNHLLSLLAQTKNRLNYQFLVQWAKLSLRNQTSEKQVPTISVQGTGKLSSNSNWLGIFDQNFFKGSQLVYHVKDGWQLTLGKLMGMKKGMVVTIPLEEGKSISTKVKSVGLDYATLGLTVNEKKKLNTEKIYKVETETTSVPLKLHLYDADKKAVVKNRIKNIITQQEGVKISAKNKADFQINIFNGQVYFSMPDCPFQSLNRQIAINVASKELTDSLIGDLAILEKWHKVHTLINPNQFGRKALIQISLITEKKEAIDITDRTHTLQPKPERYEGEWSSYFKIKVTNVTNQDLYIVALSLGSDLSISAAPFGHQCVLLPAGKCKYFYDHTSNDASVHCFFDAYKEFYNWPKEWFHYQFIVNNVEDISTSIGAFTQEGFYPPFPFSGTRGVRSRSQFQNDFWGVYTTTIELINTAFNEVSGELARDLDRYLEDEKVGAFLRKVYPKEVLERSVLI